MIDEGLDRSIPSVGARIDAALAEPVDDYDIDADLRLHKEDRIRLRAENLRLTNERDEARAEVEELREVLKIAGDRLRACSDELTEFSYQEMASVLFDLPQATEVEP